MTNDFFRDRDLMKDFIKLNKQEFLKQKPYINEIEYNRTRAKWHHKDMRTTDRELRECEPTIDDMRVDIAEHEAMNIQTKDLIEMLLSGFEGLENMPAIEIREEWNMLFGDAE